MNTRQPYAYVHDTPLNHTAPSGKEDYSTVPCGYTGTVASCWAEGDTVKRPGLHRDSVY
jgi:hypothetical protein